MAEPDPRYFSVMVKAHAAAELYASMSDVLKALEERVIQKACSAVRASGMNDGLARDYWVELAAYRNISTELENRMKAGEKAEMRAMERLQS